MQRQRHTTHPKSRTRGATHGAGAVLASATVLGALAAFPASGLATDNISVGVGGSSIVVNGTTISTSNLTLAQLAKLQGAPALNVKLELDEVAANTPAAGAVESLVAGLPLETTLATALGDISNATGGAITPQTALADVIADEGQPGAAGASGVNAGGAGAGANGSGGGAGAAGAAAGSSAAPGTPGAAGAGAKKRFTLRAASRSLKGHPGKRVSVRFNASLAGKLSYSGRKLVKGSRKLKPGANVLTFKLPRKHGNYKLVLNASSADGQRAQTTIALHDAVAKPAAHK